MKPVLRLSAALLCLGAAFGAPFGAAVADTAPKAPVVVELFTSQGCIACPPSDALLAELAKRNDVLPLALHVDYWDYIGWEDTFGAPEFTERQKIYARRSGERSIYTPQMVIGGSESVVGFEPVEVSQLIEAEQRRSDRAEVHLTRNADLLSVHLTPRRETLGATEVQLVRYLPKATIEILRGENAGKTVVYSNIVTTMEQIASWQGDAPLGLEVTVQGSDAIAVIVQEVGQGAVLGAARLD